MIMLPRLMYVGDVPVENSYHGSALLYRLLQRYPKEQLLVVESGVECSQAGRRLPDVRYEANQRTGGRLLFSRLNRLATAAFSVQASLSKKTILKIDNDFTCDAVLTVAHGFSWLTAAAVARHRNVPLHLIVHDDWPRMIQTFRRTASWVYAQFNRTFREAASRLCISPYMVEEYEHRYGVRGSVLFPSRAADSHMYTSPPSRLSACNRPLVFGFGGTINTGGHADALIQLARVLQSSNGELNIYGPVDHESAMRSGLTGANIKLCGLVPAADFVRRVRDEVDVLFLPMSFSPNDSSNMSLCFPSKLTEYTAAGLPVLIYGPTYSSAVKWGWENRNAVEVVSDDNPMSIRAAVDRLADAEYRGLLAERALKLGDAAFSHAKIFDAFCEHLESKVVRC